MVAYQEFQQTWNAKMPKDATSLECWLHLAKAKLARQRLEAVRHVAAQLEEISKLADQEDAKVTWGRVVIVLADASRDALNEKAASQEMLQHAQRGCNELELRAKALQWIDEGVLFSEPATATVQAS